MKSKQKQNNVRFITHSAIIAALYVMLTFISRLFGLDSGVIQVRISESLVALLFFTPAAIPGLTIGCFLSNLIVGCMFWDVILGTVATFLGVTCGYFFRKYKYTVFIPNIVSNALIVPFVLRYVYNFEGALWYFMITVGVGEIISCAIIGGILLKVLEKRGKHLFR